MFKILFNIFTYYFVHSENAHTHIHIASIYRARDIYKMHNLNVLILLRFSFPNNFENKLYVKSERTYIILQFIKL